MTNSPLPDQFLFQAKCARRTAFAGSCVTVHIQAFLRVESGVDVSPTQPADCSNDYRRRYADNVVSRLAVRAIKSAWTKTQAITHAR